jgi:quercetin dioxygenase-like cupin family protein
MSRKNTTSQTIFTRHGHVTYTLPTPPSTVVTVTLPPHSPWTTGLHWHEAQVEYLQVVKGSIQLTINNQAKTCRHRDGTITIPPFARHEWARAPPSFKDGDWGDVEDVVVKKWTEPGRDNEIIFRNVSSLVADESQREGGIRKWWLTLQLWVVFRELDHWPVLISGPEKLEVVVTHLVLWLVAILGGWFWGLKGVYEEYTPKRLIEAREQERGGKKGN